MSAEIVKNRNFFKAPKYVLAHFEDDDEVEIVPKDKVVNFEILKEFMEDTSKKLKIKAKFMVRNGNKKVEEIYEGAILDINGKKIFLMKYY